MPVKAAGAAALFCGMLLGGLLLWSIVAGDPRGGEPVAELLVSTAAHDQQPDAGNRQIGRPGEPGKDKSPRPNTVTVDTQGRVTLILAGRPDDIDDTAPGGLKKLIPAPVTALTEKSRFGLLPKISPDGRKPSDIYARPYKMPRNARPRIALLVTGLGVNGLLTRQAIQKLPGPVALAFSPYGRDAGQSVGDARAAGHEVMLEIPLEPFDYPDKNDPGPNTLLAASIPGKNKTRLHWLLARISGYIGVTNAMGAKFLQTPKALEPFLRELKLRGLQYFHNNQPPPVFARLARQTGLQQAAAQVTIGEDLTASEIDTALARLEKTARNRGLAFGTLALGPLTTQKLTRWLTALDATDIELIPLGAAIRLRHKQS